MTVLMKVMNKTAPLEKYLLTRLMDSSVVLTSLFVMAVDVYTLRASAMATLIVLMAPMNMTVNQEKFQLMREFTVDQINLFVMAVVVLMFLESVMVDLIVLMAVMN